MTRPQYSEKEILYDLNNNNIPGQQMFNGSTWDKQYNNAQGTLLASAARTANTTGPNQTNYNARGVQVVLRVTVASGTGGLTLYLQGQSQGGSIYWMNTPPAAITTTGTYVYEIYPANSSASSDVKQRTAGALPRTWTVSVVHGDTSSYTYQVDYSLIN